jgi:hypothetical protein
MRVAYAPDVTQIVGNEPPPRRPLYRGAAIALLIAVAAFGAGYWIGGDRLGHAPVYTGDGYVGADQASLQVGDTWYGFESSVSWTDSAGSFHDSGWPDCLPKLQAVTGVRFAALTTWVAQVGIAQVVWVDCQRL